MGNNMAPLFALGTVILVIAIIWYSMYKKRGVSQQQHQAQNTMFDSGAGVVRARFVGRGVDLGPNYCQMFLTDTEITIKDGDNVYLQAGFADIVVTYAATAIRITYNHQQFPFRTIAFADGHTTLSKAVMVASPSSSGDPEAVAELIDFLKAHGARTKYSPLAAFSGSSKEWIFAIALIAVAAVIALFVR